MTYSPVSWETSKSPGDTIVVSWPYADKAHVFIEVEGEAVSSSYYQWLNAGTIEVLTGFPTGAGLCGRRTVRSLPSEQQGSGSFNWQGANNNDKTLLYIQQENDYLETARQAVTDDLVEKYDTIDTLVATATTKASEADASATAAAASASSASGSASSAASSATAAGNSATAAAGSASTATTKASEASSSASAAAGSASTATTKASEASTSETNAAASASTATTKASEAGASATAAAGSASAAATSASNAATSETNAAAHAASIDPATLVKNTAQTLTDPQKTQARVNIDAASLTQALRDDVDQNAQSKASGLKVNILKNTLQAWEQIGDVVADTGDVTQLLFTGLGGFKKLRMMGTLYSPSGSTTTTIGVQLSSDGGATFPATFRRQSIDLHNTTANVSQAGTDAVGSFNIHEYISPNASSTFWLDISNFDGNTGDYTIGRSEMVYYGVASSDWRVARNDWVSSVFATEFDALRLVANTGLSRYIDVVLEGLRG